MIASTAEDDITRAVHYYWMYFKSIVFICCHGFQINALY